MNTFPPACVLTLYRYTRRAEHFLPSSYMEVQKGSKPLDGSVEILRNV